LPEALGVSDAVKRIGAAFAGDKTAAARINAAMVSLVFNVSSSAACRGTYISDCKLKGGK